MVNESVTADDRVKRALKLRAAGYNCAQCILMVFDDVHCLDPDTAARLSVGLGGGIAGQGEVCGAVSVMAILKGFDAYAGPESKSLTYAGIKTLCGEFATRNGSLVCRELKKLGRPCPELIEDSIRIMHKAIGGC